MLLSLFKILLFVLAVAGLIYGTEFLLNTGGDLRIAVASYEFTLGPVQTVIAGALLLLVVWLVLKLLGLIVAVLRFLAGDETAITRFFARNRERKGFKALSDANIALAAGEGDLALVKASKAEKLLRRPDLTNLIRAQAAEQSGDRDSAAQAYKRLLTDERTRFVGVRGLLKQKLSEGDTETALKLAEKAFVLKPRNAEMSDTLLQLQARNENWKAARKTLGAKLKYGNIPRDLHKRRDAILALADAQARISAGDVDSAHDEAIEAARLAPALVPAAAMAARSYVALGKPRNAAKTLKTAWAREPHPDLAAAFAEIEPGESPDERVKRFAALISQKPAHPESKMLLAELEIAAENFPAARKALGDLAETMPNARTLTLMAAIERGEGSDDSTVKAWLAKALTVSRGPQWTCDNCGHVHAEWTALCDNCNAFDTLSWKDKAEGDTVQSSSVAMLPLIVGALPDAARTAANDDGAGDDDDIIDHAPSDGDDVKKAAN
jgi:HemY protein